MTSRGDAVSRPARRPAAPLSHRVVLATGWTRRGLALLAGACGALAMAPVGFVPAMAVSLTVAVWLIDGAERTATSRSGARRHLGPTLRSAFSAGWWWGFGFFTAGLHWLGAAFLVDADKTAWLMPLGVVGLPAVLGIYAGCAFALARALWSAGPARLLALGFALLVTELLRGSLFTGFPWNEIGMALGSNLVLAQGASVIGLHGLTALAVPVFAAPATLADRDGAGRRNLAPTLLAALTLIGLAAFGVWRLAGGPAGDVPGVRLRIMQPDVFGDGEFTYENKDALLAKYLALSDRATSPDRTGLADVTHLIWPESPFPFILSRDPDALDAIGRILPKGTVLVTGAARVEGSQGSPANPPRYFNAIQVLEHDPASGAAAVGDTYDKVHLVPFGEYTPFLGLMERLGISQFVPIPGGFTPGPRHRLLHVPGLPPVVPAVCYEAIFSGGLVPRGDERLDRGVILNVSDDGWFGRTAGPWQHLAQARLRAVEQGLPLVRAANTGVSAIIDPYGRILEELPLGEAGVLDGFLPRSIAPTVFSEINQFIPSIAACLLLTVLFLVRYGDGRRRTRNL
ncbi:apolipoprotein N-acyltransferase [Lichenibacterium minor]|uniref:Apolipoprotein N-acyltransferase n=1 Tax=Lichenibacterium minor TaxID=2316528 RepID=A0A4Q2U6R2_9HYPH|nr:apolipoprotein N-acyltransferase [Lichenibacterium minor]RYC32359.1 apolipoprotein N-acyltransferase [Lichenibacterium minor]